MDFEKYEKYMEARTTVRNENKRRIVEKCCRIPNTNKKQPPKADKAVRGCLLFLPVYYFINLSFNSFSVSHPYIAIYATTKAANTANAT